MNTRRPRLVITRHTAFLIERDTQNPIAAGADFGNEAVCDAVSFLLVAAHAVIFELAILHFIHTHPSIGHAYECAMAIIILKVQVSSRLHTK